MEIIISNLILLIVIHVIQRIFKLGGLEMFSFVYYPLIFITFSCIWEHNLDKFIAIPFYLSVILASDFLSRKYGLGDYDDIGRALLQVSFYATLATTTLSLSMLVFKSDGYPVKSQNFGGITSNQLIINICLVLFSALAAYLIFIKFNDKIK